MLGHGVCYAREHEAGVIVSLQFALIQEVTAAWPFGSTARSVQQTKLELAGAARGCRCFKETSTPVSRR